MKIAVIPWNEEYLQDRMFRAEPWSGNIDNRLMNFVEMQQEFNRRGDDMHTVDVLDPGETDLFLFFEHNEEWLLRLAELGLSHRSVYCNAEPPVVNPLNSPEGFARLERLYPYILTWNDDWVDGRRIFKRHIPYYFERRKGDVPFAQRKLLVSISGNKHSDHPCELYSERDRVIRAMEADRPEDFDFYGTGWSGEGHPCYRGKAADKAEVFHHYRFALAFENMKDVKGYISEKILDCLSAGIVPVYRGAADIADYIPRDCFIPYESFASPEEMGEALAAVTEEEYIRYLDAADRFWESDARKPFEGAAYAQDIYDLMGQLGMEDFVMAPEDLRRLRGSLRKRRLSSALRRAAGKVRGR